MKYIVVILVGFVSTFVLPVFAQDHVDPGTQGERVIISEGEGGRVEGAGADTPGSAGAGDHTEINFPDPPAAGTTPDNESTYVHDPDSD